MGARVRTIDLGRADLTGRAPTFDDPVLARLASWGGSALGLAVLLDRARAGSTADAPLVLAAGEAVRAGLPTAARAALLARAPLTGRFAEGHVGGELGARLAAVADALVLEGRTELPGAVLVIGADGAPYLIGRPELSGLAPAATAAALERELGPCAVLTIGPAGERGLSFASLASGHAPPSFVGRGGMGAVLGGLGLKALCLCARPAALEPDARLVERLRRSPRLAARAAGGTLELFPAFAARGELAPELGQALAAEAHERAHAGGDHARHGCRGCPTPCGWVFLRSDGVRQGARFGASHALGVALGLETLDDALFLLGQCDELGVDAKEVGAILALTCRAQELGRLSGEPVRGRRAALARRVHELVHDERTPGRAGAAALAAELGLAHEFPSVRGQAVRAEADLAALLGQCVSSGGADPMRSFPFLVQTAGVDELARLLAPLPLPTGALDATAPAGKGRLVFWHENLVAAVDMSGFCAFSAAGLLADGLVELDELAGWILPDALRAPEDDAWRARRPGERLLAAGANLVLGRRELDRRWGAGSGDDDRPDFAREALERPGMLDEYRALRGRGPDGGPSAEARARWGTPGVLELGLGTLAADGRRAEAALPRERRAPGRVLLRLAGPPAERRELELVLPLALDECLRAACAADPALTARLYAGGRLVPAVWRAGRRLAGADPVSAGDELDLVVAIGGG